MNECKLISKFVRSPTNHHPRRRGEEQEEVVGTRMVVSWHYDRTDRRQGGMQIVDAYDATMLQSPVSVGETV